MVFDVQPRRVVAHLDKESAVEELVEVCFREEVQPRLSGGGVPRNVCVGGGEGLGEGGVNETVWPKVSTAAREKQVHKGRWIVAENTR